jgi:hypothetical protein
MARSTFTGSPTGLVLALLIHLEHFLGIAQADDKHVRLVFTRFTSAT